MPATHGRGHYFRAIYIWQWADCSSLQYLGNGSRYDWVALVPAGLDRPPFIPAIAEVRLLQDGEHAYLWRDDDVA